MPVIAVVWGVVIRMYFLQGEHNPPHIHALYGGQGAAIGIADQDVLDGSLPPKVLGRVRGWVRRYKAELTEMWEAQVFRKLPSV